jgi:hypothetical protein
MRRSTSGIVAGVVLLALSLLATSASAQITTGTVTGRVIDAQGGVIPGATVILISETRGTQGAPVVTGATGDYVFPNVTADRYTVEVSLEAFKTVKRTGITVSGGDRVGVPPLTLEPGGITETLTVVGETPLVQTQSGERSFAVAAEQVQNLPVTRGNFTSLVAFTPGVNGADTTSAGGTRLGGASQNNIMMDGISAMDTGNNGQMLNMNIESIGEVKVLTQGYQAEYGRSSGLQITAVTKSGTNQFRGSAYGVFTNSDWNTTPWVTQKNGDKVVPTKQSIYGYTVGGPVGKPGGQNKLFFFYAHEFRPQTIAINGGNVIRMRVPSALERQGNFSQSRDNNGDLVTIVDSTTGQAFPGNIIPASKLYAPGQAVLNRYPLPNVDQQKGMNYNYEVAAPKYDQLTQQPAIRIDYQMSSKLRVTGKYSGQRQRPVVTPGLIAGFSDSYVPYPFITNYAVTGNYVISPTTFFEATWGMIMNQLAGGNENGILINPESNRLQSLSSFPMLYPQAGVLDNRSYGYQVLSVENPPWFDGTNINLPPIFGWGSKIGGNCGLPSPACQRYPGWLNINRTNDFAASLTKVAGRHTMKSGFYWNHSYKAQNVGAGGVANLSFQGFVDFGNSSTNALDSGFGYSNAALGVFTQYLQQSKFVEGSLLYNQIEFYLQDNWKVNPRLTIDYGLRFVHQQPQYDQFQQMSNFFPEKWQASQAPVLYVAGCSNGATVCSGNIKNAMDPRTGQILTAPGAANTQAAIGTPIPGTGNALNGIIQAGNGIAKTNYIWPNLVVGPRFGFAYDLRGDQNWVVRGGGGLFYDRPDGNTVFSTPGNPPIATAGNLLNGNLQTLGKGLSPQPVPTLVVFQYDAAIPAQWQWNAGIQKSLPWSMAADFSYVGNHGYNRLGAFQGGQRQQLNAADFGVAYLPQYQDPTLGTTNTVPGANAYSTNLLRPYKGYNTIEQNLPVFYDTYHSVQMSLNRRFRNGLSFGATYTYGISFKGNTGINQRYQHAADGTISIRSDEAAYEALMNTLDPRPHFLKANAVWSIPGTPKDKNVILAALTNDWQISGVLTAASGPAYTLGYGYNANGTNTNITGSPDYGGRVILGNVGSGCSDNLYSQFNASAVRGPGYGSLGMESGRNYMRGCPDHTVDLTLQRSIRFGGSRRLDFRVDMFNAFNAVIINGRSTTATFDNPTSMTLVNNQYMADGSLNPNRLTPRNAGFGAATGAQNMRNIQVQIRFQF